MEELWSLRVTLQGYIPLNGKLLTASLRMAEAIAA
jgi:hypothetical protein